MGRKTYPELHDAAWLYDRYWLNDMTCAEIAEELGCNTRSVSRAMKRADIPTRRWRPARLNDKAWVWRKYVEEGYTQEEIADELGCHRGTVLKAMKRLGIDTRGPGRYREFDFEQDWLRRQYVEKGRTQEDIAREVGCSTTTVSRAIGRLDIQ